MDAEAKDLEHKHAEFIGNASEVKRRSISDLEATRGRELQEAFNKEEMNLEFQLQKHPDGAPSAAILKHNFAEWKAAKEKVVRDEVQVKKDKIEKDLKSIKQRLDNVLATERKKRRLDLERREMKRQLQEQLQKEKEEQGLRKEQEVKEPKQPKS